MTGDAVQGEERAMVNRTVRLERYYNELIARRLAGDLPSIREARRDLQREAERYFPLHGP